MSHKEYPSRQASRYRPQLIDEDPRKNQALYGSLEEEYSNTVLDNSDPEKEVPFMVSQQSAISEETLFQYERDQSLSVEPSTDSEVYHITSAADRSDLQPTAQFVEPSNVIQPMRSHQGQHAYTSARKRNRKKGRSETETPNADKEVPKAPPTSTHSRLGHTAKSAVGSMINDVALQDQEELRSSIHYAKSAYYGGRAGYRGAKKLGRATYRVGQQIVSFVRTAAKKVTSAPILKMLAAKVAAPTVVAVIVLLAIFVSLSGTFTTPGSADDVSRTYEYITKLDADRTIAFRQEALRTACVQINGYTTTQPIKLETNIDYLLQYISTKYHTICLSDQITGAFGGQTVQGEIDKIHAALYSSSTGSADIPDSTGRTHTVSCTKITVKNLPQLLTENAQLSNDEQSIMELSNHIGIYAAQQQLSNPFDDNYYVADRWGWYVNASNTRSQRNGCRIIPFGSNKVISCTAGKVIDRDADSVTVKSDDMVITYSQLTAVRVDNGADLHVGSVIGYTNFTDGLYLTVKQNSHYQNPAIMLPISTRSSGDGSSIVEIASHEIGNVGGVDYCLWYGFGGRVEWCAVFVSWCADRAGVLGIAIPKYAGVSDGIDWFRSHGVWQAGGAYMPKAGDVIFFDWDLDGSPDHTGLVASCNGGIVSTIEGNSGDTPGVCREKTYPIGYACIYGYGTPTY